MTPRARNSSPICTSVSREQMTGAPRTVRRRSRHDAPPGHRRHVGRRGRRGHGGIDRSSLSWSARLPRRQRASRELTPNDGRWMRVAASSDVPDGVMHPFDLGSVIGFVRRVDGKPEAVSGVCTHQGCRLWFDAPDDRLRCPCHSTSFAPSRPGADPSIADRSKTVAHVDGSRTRRGHRGVRSGAAEQAGLPAVTHRPISWRRVLARRRWRCIAMPGHLGACVRCCWG